MERGALDFQCIFFGKRKSSEPLGRLIGWGARIRTWAWRNQNPLPYRLATPQQSVLEVTGLYECFEWGSRVNTSIRRAGRSPVSVYVRVTKLDLFGSRSKREREADQKQDPEHDGLELRRWDMPSRPASKLDPKQRRRDCQNGQAEIRRRHQARYP
jgi:hypothetical protein